MALAGLRYFADQQPTVLRGSGAASTLRFLPDVPALHALPSTKLIYLRERAPMKPGTTVTPDPYCAHIEAMHPWVALAHVVRALERGQPIVDAQSIHVPPHLRHAATFIRQVQVCDAVLRLLPPVPVGDERVLSLVKGVCELEVFMTLWRWADRGCESPWESLMRLSLLKDVARWGCVYVTQVELWVDSTFVTTADAVIIAQEDVQLLRATRTRVGGAVRSALVLTSSESGVAPRAVGLMYDGRHHLDREQRDLDSRISSALHTADFPVLRVTRQMIEDVDP
ncbi:MAG TPA: hypothetical protein H9867_00820, partial [Candidatus Corynebacterium gallistercoris]|nr:hypothetical protein [Candidatus Corynebacterium gallistercoris]